MLRTFTRFSAWTTFLGILALYGFSLWALIAHRQEGTLWQWSESLTILKYSFFQAGVSALLATLLGVLLARAFFYLNFKGKNWLYQSITFIWVLPSLVVIFALIGFWGNSGWLAKTLAYLGIDWQFHLYGLQGILLGHLFLNIPLITKYYFEGLQLIPSRQHRLAAQLNLSGFSYFRIVELPMLKNSLPYLFTTVFLICFTSFPIVLMLGGSPKYSTLEVAIYQAVNFEFDFAKAVMLISTQLIIGIILQGLMDFTTRHSARHISKSNVVVDEIWRPTPTGIRKTALQAVLFLQIFAFFLPLASLIASGLGVSDLFTRLQNPELWQAVRYSLLLSLIASLTVVAISYLIALEARQLAYQQQKITQSILVSVTTLPIILPVFMLAVGLFLLFMDTELSTTALLILVGVCNGLMLLPYIYRLLYEPMWQAFTRQDKLAQSLGLKGLRRWWIVEKNALIRPLVNALALALASSLGSFSIIAFFGSPDFSALPYLLYQQLGSYQTENAAVTALVLLIFTLLPFLLLKPEITPKEK